MDLVEEPLRNSLAHARTRRLPLWCKTISYQSSSWKSVGWKPTTPDKILAVEKFEKDSAEWIKKDAQARHIIMSTLPNTLFMHVRHTNTAEEYFDILKGMFETRSPAIGVELQ